MLARRLTTILPAMTLAEVIETMHIYSVASLTDDRRALVTTPLCRGPAIIRSPLWNWSVGARYPCWATCRWSTTVCASWMSCRSAGVYLVEVLSQATKNASPKDALPQAINLAALAPLATRLGGSTNLPRSC
jgi:Magnesium chelatase, subunit ChlI